MKVFKALLLSVAAGIAVLVPAFYVCLYISPAQVEIDGEMKALMPIGQVAMALLVGLITSVIIFIVLLRKLRRSRKS